jgi:hypothetical protein
VRYAAVAPSAPKQRVDRINTGIGDSSNKYQACASFSVSEISRTCKDYYRDEALVSATRSRGCAAATGPAGLGSPEGERCRGGRRCRRHRGSPEPMSCRERSPRPAEPSGS